jgi:hypothetical protein
VVKIRTEIKTERLILRDLQTEDANFIAEQVASLNITKHLAVVPHPYGLLDAQSFVEKAISEQANDKRANYEFAITSCVA